MPSHHKPSTMLPPPEGRAVMGASAELPGELEQSILAELDTDKINDLAECLFVLNNRRFGPIAGAYMVVCTKPGEQWCVAQLNADRLRPILLFEDKVFASPELAREEALRIKQERGEPAPGRCT